MKNHQFSWLKSSTIFIISCFLFSLGIISNPTHAVEVNKHSLWAGIEATSSITREKRIMQATSGIFAYVYDQFGFLPVYSRLGISLLAGRIDNRKELYANLELGLGVRTKGKLSFIGGIGTTLGENFFCPEDDIGNETCQYGQVVGFYPEAGFLYEATKNVKLGLVGRNYQFSKGMDDNFSFGGMLIISND